MGIHHAMELMMIRTCNMDFVVLKINVGFLSIKTHPKKHFHISSFIDVFPLSYILLNDYVVTHTTFNAKP